MPRRVRKIATGMRPVGGGQFRLSVTAKIAIINIADPKNYKRVSSCKMDKSR